MTLNKGFVILMVATLALLSTSTSASDVKRSLAPRVPHSQSPWAALIVGTGASNTFEYVCSGSILDKETAQTHILTTAFCIQDRQDSTGQPVKYHVLIEDPEGNVTLGTTTFSQWEVDKTFLHPNASRIFEFVFTSRYPNGTEVDFNVAVAPYDLGIIRLAKSVKSLQSVTPVELSKTLPTAGSPVQFVGYGGPLFFSLGASIGTEVIPSMEITGANQIQNGKLLFLRDARASVLPNETQAVEPGDEGSAIVDAAKKQVGIVVGSWQINPNTTEVITFATLGPAIGTNLGFIESVIHETTDVHPSNAAELFLNFAAAALAALLIMA